MVDEALAEIPLSGKTKFHFHNVNEALATVMIHVVVNIKKDATSVL